MGVSALWPYHAVLMTSGFLLLVTGMVIARYMKTRRWGLKIHKTMGIVGATFALSGLLMAIYMVSSSTGVHFGGPHTYMGAITIISVGMTPILGYAQFKFTIKGAIISAIHRWSGRITLVLMFITILSGLSLVGIL